MAFLSVVAYCSIVCVAAAPPRCNTSYLFCNASIPTELRIRALLKLATLEEKAGLTYGRDIERLGVPKLQTGEALHGVVQGCVGGHGRDPVCPTSFPSALGLGASFNESLFAAVGAAIATESRALQPGGTNRWAPDVNLFRSLACVCGQGVCVACCQGKLVCCVCGSCFIQKYYSVPFLLVEGRCP